MYAILLHANRTGLKDQEVHAQERLVHQHGWCARNLYFRSSCYSSTGSIAERIRKFFNRGSTVLPSWHSQEFPKPEGVGMPHVAATSRQAASHPVANGLFGLRSERNLAIGT